MENLLVYEVIQTEQRDARFYYAFKMCMVYISKKAYPVYFDKHAKLEVFPYYLQRVFPNIWKKVISYVWFDIAVTPIQDFPNEKKKI